MSRTVPATRGRHRGALPAVAIVSLMALTACSLSAKDATSASSAGTGNSGSYTTLSPGGSQTDADKAALAALPASVQDTYAGFWNSTRLGPNPYANWTPSAAPWKFCYSSAYQGNSWRVEGLDVARNIVAQLKTKGLVDGDLVVADANNSASLQATQINTMVQQGCDVILAMQPPSVGLCSAFNAARNSKVLVVAMQTGTDCTNIIQSDFGEYYTGAASAKWLVEKTGGKGTAVMCDGIPGVAAAEARQAGARKVFTDAGMTVQEITGQWTPSTVKSEMLKYLSTHQGAVAGVWDAGVCAVAVDQAFQQAGKSLPYVTGFEGACSWLAAWKQNGKESIGFSQSAGQGVVEAMKVALRMLSGQQPKVNTLLYPLQTIDASNFGKYYKNGMSLTSTCNAQPVGNQSVPGSYYDALFTGGKAAPVFDSNLDSLPIS
jgi:ribose transport system substrate-binding protein